MAALLHLAVLFVLSSVSRLALNGFRHSRLRE